MSLLRFLFRPRQHQCNAYLETCLGLALLLALLAGAAALMVSEARGQDRTGLDLPIKPVRYGDPYPEHAPRPDTTGEDDPRDTPPPTFYGEDLQSKGGTVVYVLDRSGSMAFKEIKEVDGRRLRITRWDQAKGHTLLSIAALPEDWRFNVVTYATTILSAFDGLETATEVNKAKAAAWLAPQRCGGGTATGASMAYAFQSHRDCDLFALLTDGIPNSGPGPCRRSIRNNNVNGARVDTYGIGAVGSFRAFLQGVAADSGGSYTDVQ